MEYVAIALDSFLAGSVIGNDVFIRLETEKTDKYIKLWKKGQTLDKTRLQRYTDQNIDTVYLTKIDFKEYSEACLKLGDAIAHRQGLGSVKKIAIIHRIATNVLAGFEQKGFDEEAFRTSETLLKTLVSSLGNDLTLESLIHCFQGMGDGFVKDSLAVAAVSIMLSKCLGWKNQRTLDIVAMAGLFHDIGFKELPSGLYHKRRVDMTNEEIKLYESHPDLGVKILSSINSIPTEVIKIVQDHHEELSGAGFPKKLAGDKVFPLSRITFFAQKIVDHVMPSHKDSEAKDAKDAICHIIEIHRRDIKYEMEMALMRLGKIT